MQFRDLKEFQKDSITAIDASVTKHKKTILLLIFLAAIYYIVGSVPEHKMIDIENRKICLQLNAEERFKSNLCRRLFEITTDEAVVTKQ